MQKCPPAQNAGYYNLRFIGAKSSGLAFTERDGVPNRIVCDSEMLAKRCTFQVVYTYMQGLQAWHEARVSGWRARVPRLVLHETQHLDSAAVEVTGAVRVAGPPRRPARSGSRSESCRRCWAMARQCPRLRTGSEGPGPGECPRLRVGDSGPRGPAGPTGVPLSEDPRCGAGPDRWPDPARTASSEKDRPGQLNAGAGQPLAARRPG